MTGAAADLVQRFHAVFVHPCCHLVGNGLHGAGVCKVCGTHLHCGGTCHNEFQCVTAGGNAAQTHHRNVYSIRKAMGRTAGPDKPAKMLLNTGRRFSKSMAQA